MSGETEGSVSAWTPDTLKVLEDEKIQALERSTTMEFRRVDERHDLLLARINELLKAREMAQNKFEESVAHSFVQVNEFRGSLDDLGKNMATRRELESQVERLADANRSSAAAIADLRSRIDVGPADLRLLQSRVDTSGGRQQGVTSTQQLLIALAGILIAFAVYWANHQKTTPVVVNPTMTVPSK